MFTSIINKMVSNISSDDLVTEKREVSHFDRVRMNDYGELTIIQGPSSGLTITTHHTLIDRIEGKVNNGQLILGYGSWWDKLGEAFTTSLTRKPIIYRLMVEDLKSLEICGMARVMTGGFISEELAIKVRGVANADLRSLQIKRIDVVMEPGGKIKVDGHVQDQRISIKGPGIYDAQDLLAQNTVVSVQGPGQAVVRVKEHLDVRIVGPGRVFYYGKPSLKKQLTAMAMVKRLLDSQP